MDDGTRQILGFACFGLAWTWGTSWFQAVLVYVAVMALTAAFSKEN